MVLEVFQGWHAACLISPVMASERIKAVLFDLDGVLYVGDEPIPGAGEALERIAAAGLQRAFVTNTTTRPAREVWEKLQRLGFAIEAGEIFTAVSATRAYLREQGWQRVRLLVRDSILPEFEGFTITEESPEAVVIGDIGAAWEYSLLNSVFRNLMDGACFVAMHRNKYWQTEDGLRMDIGAFVAGLEYVSGVKPTIVGKPSAPFFASVLARLGVVPQEAVMIGDDIESDIGGGNAAGVRGYLVRTGKFREDVLASSAVQPEAVGQSIADLPGWLGVGVDGAQGGT